MLKKGDKNMDFIKKNVSKWVSALIVLTIGILCIVAGAKLGSKSTPFAKNDSLDAISVVLGIVLIVVASLALLFALAFVLYFRRSLLVTGIGAAIVLGVGISLVVSKYAGTLIWIIITVVPYVLVTIGAVILADALCTLFRAISINKVKSVLAAVIFTFVLGAASFVIGFLCMSFGGNDPVIASNIQLIIFGVIVTLYALLLLTITFVKIPSLVVVKD